MTKIQVPEGMLKASYDVHCNYPDEDFSEGELRAILEAALHWLSEHPIVPTGEQYAKLMEDMTKDGMFPIFPEAYEEWGRRMFLAEPEIPEEVKDLLIEATPENQLKLLEAYRRGQRSKG